MIKLSSYALTTALLTHAGLASAECTGTISTFSNGDCTYDNFVGGLVDGCLETEFAALLPEGETDAAAYIDQLCAYDAPTQFVEIQGTYQKDRRYFAGGGILVDGSDWAVDSARIARFNTNSANSTLIAFPEYLARLAYNSAPANVDRLGTNGYPANMNLDTSCDLNTVMCCFTDDTKMNSFATNNDSTTGVCHHELELSPESNHIEEGWSVFPGSETSTHCTGFTWNDGEEELLGNMMYDISLKNTIEKGYVKGVPGAPMCGCIEHMPVVASAECRTASKSGDGAVTYTFTYDAEEGVRADNQVGITYSDCGTDLKTAYKNNQAVGDDTAKALIDEHLVGDCASDDYLREDHFLEPSSDHPTKNTRYISPDDNWSDLFVGEGINFLPPDKDLAKTDEEFRALVDAGCKESDTITSRPCIIRRTCASCSSVPHRDIYYKPLTAIPAPEDLNLIDMFMDNWEVGAGTINVDYALYSTYEDALNGTNEWTHCNLYNNGVGFPGYCSTSALIYADQWNSYTRYGHGHANHHGFYVELPLPAPAPTP